MWQSCEAITGGTAETVTITGLVNYLRITNGIADELHLKFNWAAGDDEVSATNYDVALDDYDSLELIRRSPSFPKFQNVRVLGATSGSIAFLGW
jgi:hypothetical protein